MSAVVAPQLTLDNFESGDIDAENFDHEAHVYMGWLYACTYPLPEAIAAFDAALKRLVNKLGADGKYHATLTWFFLILIGERVETNQTWHEFRDQNPDIFNSKTLLARYYSEERLFSAKARQQFLLPGLADV